MIGYDGLLNNNVGWLRIQFDKGHTQDSLNSIYITSFYWVITSFSSIGYGDVTAITQKEKQFALLIEMLGIGVFGYMIGTIQTLFIGLQQGD